jgi:hypothetical protein
MSVQQIKQGFRRIFRQNNSLNSYELKRIFQEAFSDWEIERGWPEGEKGKPWTDDELRVVLSDPPTKGNCLKHARGFQRGYGAIEQIYRWAATSDAEIKKRRPTDKFVKQIRKVAKQLGWRA